MSEFQESLIEIRKKIVNAIRKELMGPGSEVSYPDDEHELISENPVNRYSVGMLYPQETKYGVSESDAEDKIEEEIEEADIDSDTQSSEEDIPISDTIKKKSVGCDCDVENDDSDDDINKAQQNKPSSMGFTFFIDGDVNEISVYVEYAKYQIAKEDEIIIPCPVDNLYIPECLNSYIKYDPEKKTIQKLSSIKWRELDEVFERNAVEDPYLLDILRNLNQVYRNKKAYKREPFKEPITLEFGDKNFAKKALECARGYISGVKHAMNNGITGITVMLVNEETAKQGHIFQPRLTVESSMLSNRGFVSYNHLGTDAVLSEEEQSLDLLYRNKLVFGTGHGVSVDWDIQDGIGKIFTEFLPDFEVPKINLGLRKESEAEKSVNEICLSMKYLSDLHSATQEEKLTEVTAFLNAYGAWIDVLQNQSDHFEIKLQKTAQRHINLCRESFLRMKNGIDILKRNDMAWQAFSLANRAMFMQRIHGNLQATDHYPDDEELQQKLAELNYAKESDSDARWRPFQLAFLLMSVTSIVEATSVERDLVDLIWFPTGGGKTEAYLGLTALTIFYRRLSNPEHGGGTAVMMRYTLRLLTSQQFTRASTLICACEKIRQDEECKKFQNYALGTERITIGLWIGSQHIPNKNDGDKSAKYFYDKLTGTGDLKYRKDCFNKFQVLKCPWCGTKMVQDEPRRGEIKGKWGYKFHNNKHFYLSCPQEGCEFEKELPIQIIDEELYNNPPTLLFGTVDKFAIMAWKKDVRAFFGGDENDAPDLIIQDELHLIAGPLGTMVGIYETAIDYLCSHKGKKPKIVASTATIRQAAQQCRFLYNREVRQFPAQGLDAADSFFAKEIDTKDDFGRLYIGIMPSGKTKVMLQARATAVALQRIKELNCTDKELDQYYTLAIYFNSIKELGKASSVIADDVKDFIKRLTYRQIFKFNRPRTIGAPYELTSRVSTSGLNETLDKLEHAEYSKQNIAEKKYPVDVLLATNMISVGVDVSRLNIMFLQGQPKSVSEYIQASSRIGRKNPGIAIALYDSSKSRDRSHYEQFRAFHESFYKFVEPTGITPFSAPARDRALHAIILAGLRQSIGSLSADNSAGNIIDEDLDELTKDYMNFIYNRVKLQNSFNPAGMIDDSDVIRNEIEKFLTEWKKKADLSGDKLCYGDKYIYQNAPQDVSRMIKTFEDKGKDDAYFTLTSLRNVDKSVPVSVLIWEDEYGKN